MTLSIGSEIGALLNGKRLTYTIRSNDSLEILRVVFQILSIAYDRAFREMSASILYSTGLPADQDTNESQRTKFFVANMKYEFTEEDVKEWFSVSKLAFRR